MTIFRTLMVYQTAALVLFLALSVSAFAQVSGKAFQGFSSNSKDPIQIEADTLEVIESKAVAIYTGNVKVQQGSSVITTSKMVAHFNNPKEGGQREIEKIVMTGGVVVTSGENTVVGDKGTYELKTENVVLTGKKVVISQGCNVATGTKLVANLKTNKATLSGGGGRVGSVFTPGSAKGKKTKQKC